MIALLLGLAAAQQGVPTESRLAEARPAPAPHDPFDAFALFQARTTASDLTSTNPLLDGQVVGVLGGSNGVIVDPEVRSLYTEQRTGVFFTWRPQVADGKAALHAAFELDWAFGDRSYGTGGNLGGGFGADQVNLQTRRLYASFYPRLSTGHDLHVAVGLQFVGDSVADPTTATPDELLRSGGRLMFWGSEAAGVAAYGRIHDAWSTRLRYRAGAFTLIEQGLGAPDDVLLLVADASVRPTWSTDLGLHAWYIQDRSGGTGGALGSGPTSDLWALQGGPALDPYDGFPPPADATIDADVVWLGADVAHNAPLTEGPVGVHAVVVGNFGRIYAPIAQDDAISGLVADAEARVRWTRGRGSVLRAELLWASPMGIDPGRYGGPVTGNAWGVAGAVWSTHGTLLLHPDPGSINRMVAVVSDVSGEGRGLTSISASAGLDPIPDRLTVTATGAHALDSRGIPHGTELNGKIAVQPLPFCSIGAAAGSVLLPAASPLAANPWTVLGTVDWLVF